MDEGIRFVMGGQVRTVRVDDPTVTVLDWLRAERRTGTKEGCAEGDCGACTVVLAEMRGPAGTERLRYRAVNACILFLPTLDGKALYTVEDLRDPATGDLHPVQRAMVEQHGSQCGFCTPGFVMSLFALVHDPDMPGTPDRAAIDDALAGNLCRCTGYRPIVAAARQALAGDRADRFAAAEAETLSLLQGLRRPAGRGLALDRYRAPTTVAELAEVLTGAPDSQILGGGTDVGLWVTKDHRALAPIVYTGAVAEMADVTERAEGLDIGAAATYTDALPALERHFPAFGTMLRRLGAVQVRNSGTMGGNVANGSPIGDSMPPLIALGTTIVLNRGGSRREIALEDFYLGYRRKDLQPGEFVERIRIPLAPADRRLGVYKVSKRPDQDISAVCAGFALRLVDGVAAGFRAGFGGMAAVPSRARACEAAVEGRPWTLETVTAGMAALAGDFEPLTDMRASADYRALVARNLLMKFYLETTGQDAGQDAGLDAVAGASHG